MARRAFYSFHYKPDNWRAKYEILSCLIIAISLVIKQCYERMVFVVYLKRLVFN
jgi:hypothetical protein